MTWKREEATAVASVWDMIGVGTVEERNNADDVRTRAGMRVMIGKWCSYFIKKNKRCTPPRRLMAPW